MEIEITMTELRQSLGKLVNQAAFGNNRLILMAHGQPKAAIIGVAELEQLRQLAGDPSVQPDKFSAALTTTDDLRRRIREWQETYNVDSENSVDTLNQLRAERDEFDSMH